MKLITPPTLAAVLSAFLILNIATALAQTNFGQNIYTFHKKLAENGNKLSQYKLGTMYELGLGTKSNIEEAIRWYTISSEKGHTSAANRLTYLQIRKDGYSADIHSNWLDNLRKQVQENDAESIFLVGQLYQHGVGVDKNPNQAILLFKKAGAMGMIEADLQIETLESQQASGKKVAIAIKKPLSNTKPTKQAKPDKSPKISKEEKRRRYEVVMKKLEQERLLLEKQQQWAESL